MIYDYETRFYTLLMAWLRIKDEKDIAHDREWAKVLDQIESLLRGLS